MFAFGTIRPTRRPSLTPMIDVVFLLLVFFMLAARFGMDAVVPLQTAGVGAVYQGPPRLVDVTPTATLLNGVAVTDPAAALAPLMQGTDDAVLLRGRDGATVQQLVDVLDVLRAAGMTRVILVE